MKTLLASIRSIMLLVFALNMLFFLACGGDLSVALPGCEDCPDRCVRTVTNQGRCMDCLKDEQCQSATSPTRKCLKNKCVCGTDKDCPQNKYCDGSQSCADCLKDKDCKDSKLPVCLTKKCVQCNPGAIQSCSPKGVNACVKGQQKCGGSGFWGACDKFVVCKPEERCVDSKCKPSCPKPAPCKKDDKQCNSAPNELPGKYKTCVLNGDNCYEWSKQEKFCDKTESCEKGQCNPFTCPKPECKENETRCVGEAHFQLCGRDSNNCIVWKDKESCATGKTCYKELNKCAVCKPKAVKDCYDGKAGTKGKGVCLGGKKACKDDGSGYGDCQGQVVPTNELCNNLDDDCDGTIDNGFPTKNDKCDVGVGECKNENARLACKANGLGVECSGKPLPSKPEICDGKDNDCDGKIDNIKGSITPISEKCYAADPKTKGVGLCTEGTKTCKSGSWGKCENEVQPSKELCDGKDNDCDGDIDEDFKDLKTTCELGKGECKAKGRFVCKQDGSGKECDAQVGKASKEICDGRDNDCDGDIDEDFRRLKTECIVGIGACLNKGKWVCKRDGSGEECSVQAKTKTVELCDGIDNDCDGSIDEDFKKLKTKCTAGLGNCIKSGIYVCKKNGFGEECNVKPGAPSKEICDGADNDCDGKIDNGLPLVNFYPDKDGDKYGDKTAAAVKKCAQQAPAKYVTNNRDCNDNDSKIKPGVSDVCDGVDNDCDGKLDENSTHYSWYRDNDKDSYGAGSIGFRGCIKVAGIVCTGKNSCRNSIGYVNNNRDCCDRDANARPGQSAYYTSPNNCGSFDYNCDRRATPNVRICTCSRQIVYTYSGYADRYCNGWSRWYTPSGKPTYKTTSCEMNLSLTLQPPGSASCNASCSNKKCLPWPSSVCRRASCSRTRYINGSLLRRTWTPRAYNSNKLIMWHKNNYSSGCAYLKTGYAPKCGQAAYRAGSLQTTPNATYSNGSVSRATVSCSDSSWPAKCSASKLQTSRYSYRFTIDGNYRFTITTTAQPKVPCR